MSAENEEVNIDIALSLQRALIGAVTPNLRGVTFGWTYHRIVVRFIYDGEVTIEDLVDAGSVASDVIADFLPPCIIDQECLRFDYPRPLELLVLRDWAYRRKEDLAPLPFGPRQSSASRAARPGGGTGRLPRH